MTVLVRRYAKKGNIKKENYLKVARLDFLGLIPPNFEH